MTEIYINNELIELFDDEEIVISYAVNNLFEIESRQGTFSNSFKIPATKKNNIIFGFTNNVLSVSDLPYLKLPCLIYVDGILQVDGIAQILTATPSEYEIRVLGSNANWFELIADKSIQTALSDCQYTHYWTEATVTGSRSNIWSDVFIYPNIDYGGLFFEPIAGPPYFADWFKLYPAIYCKYLFKQIFDNVGLSIESDWFDNDKLFERQIIPFSAEWKRDKNYSLRDYGKWDNPLDSFFSPEIFIINLNPPPFGWWRTDVRKIWPTNTIDSSCYNALNIPAECLRILDGVSITLQIDLRAIWSAGVSDIVFGMYAEHLDENGILIQTTIFDPQDIANNVPMFGQSILTATKTFNVGRSDISFYYFGYSQFMGNALQVPDFQIEILDYIALETDEGDLEINQTFNWVTLGSTLPDITQTDFILTIANQYGLIFEQIPLTNTVRIFQFGKVIENIPKALDWSNKLDLSEDYSINFLTDVYAQNNYFQYAEDTEDEYLSRQPNLGQGVLTLATAPVNTDLVVFESVFAPLIRLKSFNGPSGFGGVVPLAWVPVYENGVFNSLTGRLGYVQFDDSALLTIAPGGFYTDPQPNVYFEDLSFSNLLPKYYPLITQIIKGNKSINCLVRLNNIDINQLDFSIPIWIDYFGAYFYINEISQYKVTDKDSTQISLILIVN